MHWTDFLRPERAFAFVAKLFFGILALLIIASLIFPVLGRMQFSGIDQLGVLVGLMFLSAIAYLVRERRLNARPRPRNTRGAERTPLLPRTLEEE